MQHIIPRVYLKYFQIDEKENKSFVQCIDFSNKYKQTVERKGINDVIFKVKHFYNNNQFKNPYHVEDFLGENIEPKYEKIMLKVNNEESFNLKLIGDIVFWLYVSKMRSPYIRANLTEAMNWFIELERDLNNRVLSEDKKDKIKKEVNFVAKEAQIELFAKEEKIKKMLTAYYDSLLFKQWKILKSNEKMPFWTNDNPGFSVNLNPKFEDDKLFYNILDLNKNSVIYYVLSPKYCLELHPLAKINNEVKFVLNSEIEYESTSDEMINFINKGVFETKYKLLISNSYKLLSDNVKWKIKTATN